MVCLGNICRSPLAEGILQSKLDPEKYEVDSAGTGAYHVGNPPDPRSIAIANQFDIDIRSQRARQFHVLDFEKFDYIYAMDLQNYRNIVALAPDTESKNKVQLILEAALGQQSTSVPDPYYGGDDGFLQVYTLLDKACTAIAKKLV